MVPYLIRGKLFRQKPMLRKHDMGENVFKGSLVVSPSHMTVCFYLTECPGPT